MLPRCVGHGRCWPLRYAMQYRWWGSRVAVDGSVQELIDSILQAGESWLTNEGEVAAAAHAMQWGDGRALGGSGSGTLPAGKAEA